MSTVSRTLRQVGTDSAYLIVAFPVALAGYIVVFTLFSVGLGMLITVVGIPILVGSLYAARGFAEVNRLALPAVLHRPAPRPRYRSARPDAGFWRKLLTPLGDGQSWLDLLHACLYWILATIGFSFAVTWWAGALGGVTYPLWDWAIPRGRDSKDLNVLLGFPDTYTSRATLYFVMGVVFLVTLPLIIRLFALLQAQFSRALLSGIAEVQHRIGELSEQRDSAVSAEATALRRLERDIHDGPQQRLVRLAMDLGRARQQVESDPAAAQATIDEALGQARETLDELRALSRGIAPPILADRGLPAALQALAARGVVPVGLTVDPKLGRLAPVTESTAYFVVAEALTNVAKHSRAGFCGIDVRRADNRLPSGLAQVPAHDDLLIVSVVDDGDGGAHVAKGHGLAGLADRVRATGGTLSVSSPAGGPTEIRAELPCG
jgi:signal transduction histidine kinase